MKSREAEIELARPWETDPEIGPGIRYGYVTKYHRDRFAFREAPDVGEKIVALCDLLDDTWLYSVWRARIADRYRMAAKQERKARAIRLLVHLVVHADAYMPGGRS